MSDPAPNESSYPADASPQETPPERESIFAPPKEPIEVACLHCRRVYSSALIRWVPVPGPMGGHWVCPVPGCGACGFNMDIFPTDPNYQDERGSRMEWVDDAYDYDAADQEHEAAAREKRPCKCPDCGGDPKDFPYPCELDETDPLADGEEPDGEQIAAEHAESVGQFEPPRDWTPESDEDDEEDDDFDDVLSFPLPEGAENWGKPFTQADHDAAIASGAYERDDAELRAQEIRYNEERAREEAKRRARKEAGEPEYDDDIPF